MDFRRVTPPQRPNPTPTTAPSPVVDLEALGHDPLVPIAREVPAAKVDVGRALVLFQARC